MHSIHLGWTIVHCSQVQTGELAEVLGFLYREAIQKKKYQQVSIDADYYFSISSGISQFKLDILE